MSEGHWRDSMRTVKFFALDARAASVWVLLIAKPSWWTLGALVVSTAGFWELQRRGMTVRSGLRRLRSWIVGRWRPATVTAARRRMCRG